MATVHVTFCAAVDGPAPVVAGVPEAKQTITSSGTTQSTTIAAAPGNICQITATGGNVWAAFGASPTAAAGSDHLIIDGQTREFGFLAPGYKVAIIDA